MNHALPRSRAIVLPLMMVILAIPSGARGQTVDDFEARSYTDGTFTIPYRLFVPADYDPEQSYPLVLFLHGAGERGTDNRLQLTGQTAPLVFVRPENQAQWPCFMLAPQCPPGGNWANLVQEQPATPMRLALESITDLMNEFNIDPDRLYITGLSMGGFGTWDTITRYPGLFAAAVPIAGGGDVSLAYRCAQTPIWAFHGDADRTVPVERTREMIAAVIAAGGNPLYTEYPGAGHVDSWNLAYAEPDLLPWLFAN
jgi:predicted peptidase